MTDWDDRFLEMAQLVGSWSKDPSTKVGAVVVDPTNRHVISVGYNGFPASMPDDPALYADREEKLSRIVHAEINALIHAGGKVYGKTLYTWPFLACSDCFVILANAGVTRFVAPKATGERLDRWAAAFNRVYKYAAECGIEVVEVG